MATATLDEDKAEAKALARRAGERSGPATAKGSKKKGSKKLFAVIILVVVVAGFGLEKFALPKHKPKVAVPGSLLKLPVTTVNLPSGGLLQVGLAVEVEKGTGGRSGIPAWDIAQMEDDEITILSVFPEQTLLSAAGKAEAKADLLEAFRKVVGPGPVGPGVMAVYYTDLVMQ
jgi:flagellar basal body-associated protein FliL